MKRCVALGRVFEPLEGRVRFLGLLGDGLLRLVQVGLGFFGAFDQRFRAGEVVPGVPGYEGCCASCETA